MPGLDCQLPSTTVNKPVEPYIDLGNLLLIDTHHSYQGVDETALFGETRDNVQYLFNNLSKLERTSVDAAICVKLPKPSYRLPREKPIPEEKHFTKWQQYAKDKGIVKHKRSKKVFDETTKTYAPRYGYKRAKMNENRDWLIEIPDGKDPMVDYFAEGSKDKEERRSKNELQRLRNLKRRGDFSTRNQTEPLGVSISLEQRNKYDLIDQSRRAWQATASVGRHQEGLKIDKTHINTGQKHKFQPNEVSAADENKRHLEILCNISRNVNAKKVDETRLAASQRYTEENNPNHNQSEKSKKKKGVGHSAIHRKQHFTERKKGKKSFAANKKQGRRLK